MVNISTAHCLSSLFLCYVLPMDELYPPQKCFIANGFFPVIIPKSIKACRCYSLSAR